jgi:hypothetical protein
MKNHDFQLQVLKAYGSVELKLLTVAKELVNCLEDLLGKKTFKFNERILCNTALTIPRTWAPSPVDLP